jgi:hypothetical protein
VIPDGEAIAGSQLALRLVRYLTAAAMELQHGFTVHLEGPGGSDGVIFRHPNDTDPKTTDAKMVADWLGRFSINMVEVLGKIGVDLKESSRLWRVKQLDDPENNREVNLRITPAEEARLEVRPEELVVAWERFLGEVTQTLETFHGLRWRRYRDQAEWLMANPSIPLSAVQQWEDEGKPLVELPDYVVTLARVLPYMKEEVGHFIQIGEFSRAAEEMSRARILLAYIVDGIRETVKEHEGPQEVLERSLKLEEGNAESYLASLSTIQVGFQSWQKRLEGIASGGLEKGRGFVLVEGVGMLAPPDLPAGRYYVVAIGIEQAAALIQAGRAPGRILAVATGLEEAAALAERGILDDQIVRAWEWPTLEAARDYAVRLGREWLAGLGGLQVSVLEVTARSLQGILAQLQEMLPSAWQTARPITAQDAERTLDLAV